MKIIDISVPLFAGCPAWPGDGQFHHRFIDTIAGGSICNTSVFECSAHMGTHLDAPRHFVEGGRTVEQLDPALFVGPARVVETADEPHVSAAALEAAVGNTWPQRLLLRTRNSRPGGALSKSGFDRDFCALTGEAAELIVARGVKLVGIDYYSVAPFDQGRPAHDALLGAEVIALEGLDLRQVGPGEYHLIALPIKLAGFDGAPVRAVLIAD